MSPKLLVLLIHLLSFLFNTTMTASIPDPIEPKERQALLDFINSPTLFRNRRKLNWNPSEPACSWKGVKCDDENKAVLWLRLPAISLVGQIPLNSLGLLTNLRVLSLRINNLTGTIPSDFSNLNQLTRLTLYQNNFTGQLPNITSTELKAFNVSLNKLSTSIPSTLAKFPVTAFSNNVYVCGPPTPYKCNSSYPIYEGPEKPKKNPKKGRVIVGVSVGSGILLVILLCCARNKVYQKDRSSHSRRYSRRYYSNKQPQSAERCNKLVLLDYDEDGDSGFGLDDMFKASAEVLGEGSAGISYKQELVEKKRKTKMTVVVKRLRGVVLTDQKEFGDRMEVLGKMKNENVVRYRAYYYSSDDKLLVSEYISGGSLSASLHGSIGSARRQLDWDHRIKIALSAAKGLAYLHEAGIIHGNIKSTNILLQQEPNNEAFVSDYGLHTLFVGSSSRVMGYHGPDPNVTLECDVYSFGVLLLEILTTETPKQASTGTYSEWVKSIVCKEPMDGIFDVELRRDHDIEEMVQLLRIAKDCVSSEPDERPTMRNVVSMMEDMWLRPSSDDHSKGFDFTPSTDTRDTPSTITP